MPPLGLLADGLRLGGGWLAEGLESLKKLLPPSRVPNRLRSEWRRLARRSSTGLLRGVEKLTRRCNVSEARRTCGSAAPGAPGCSSLAMSGERFGGALGLPRVASGADQRP